MNRSARVDQYGQRDQRIDLLLQGQALLLLLVTVVAQQLVPPPVAGVVVDDASGVRWQLCEIRWK
jgi:hypothetical protein